MFLKKIKRLLGLIFDYYKCIRISILPKNKKFSYIYKSKYWQNIEDGSLSGPGSNKISTSAIKPELEKFMINNNIKSIIDIPCGDWKWMSEMNLANTNYTGCDVVDDLINSNNSLYSNDHIKFYTKDLLSDTLPNADFIIIRDLLVHLDISDIKLCLNNIKNSEYRFIGITNYPNLSNNENRIFGDRLRVGDKWRPINLTKSPYNLPDPEYNLNDNNALTKIDHEKYLSIWSSDSFNPNYT